MTPTQRTKLMAYWWPAAAKAQGWSVNDRAKRLTILSQAVGRELETASDLNTTTDIDRVKAHLGMLAENLAATIELTAASAGPDVPISPGTLKGTDRRTRDRIRNYYLPCLALYHDNPEALLAALIRDKFQHGARAKVGTASRTSPLLPRLTINDLAGRDLDQILYTISRVLSKHRQAAGDTEHDMRMKAKLPCHCATYCGGGGASVPASHSSEDS